MASTSAARAARPGLAPAPQAAWSVSAPNPLVSAGSPRLPETLLALGLAVETQLVPGLGFPHAELAMILLLALAAFRAPRRDLARFALLGLVAAGLLAYLVAVTLHNDLDPTRRITRITLLAVFVYAVASERLDVKGVLYGMAAGGLINVPLFYAGIAPDEYGGYLTGYLVDKNVSGLFYALVPILLMAVTQRGRVKLALFVGGLGLTFLTGSRTSLAALLCAGLWVLISPYLGRVLRLALLYVMGLGVSWAELNLADLGIFGDRTGTDWFRERIHEASAQKVAETSWFGQGLSTAWVELENTTMFFHNSYLGLLVEGGWPFLVVVVGAYVLLCLRPFSSTLRSPSRVAVEAAAAVLLVTSLQLGEVFITVTGSIVLGMGLLLTAHEAQTRQGRWAHTPTRTERIRARARREGLPTRR